MKKILISAAAILTIAVPIGNAIAQPTKVTSNFARITNFSEFPKGIRHMSTLRHTLKITISEQSNGVSKIMIEAPDNIKLNDNIDVSNQSGEKINAEINIDDKKKATLTFSEPVPPGTKLTIEMNKVRKLRATRGEMLYKVFANFVDSNQAVPVGIARLRVN
ncbi:DUF2808 domain-containing protein [Rivularia sp. UHCC 0363]|uniref:DUF2808 domain-containing protein n=1 Tax=Rivularia sp. UHCC 0363 TaxID=3110244 RepID=UPI002B1E997C|nr:DUF2808 domain-containing protein [Rivularia sp. UHCC 0363]MEA5594087.1 DUF2808 domain-containing protein [Rivularia sp. UHCC 0363]